MSPPSIRVATRSSPLARWQAERVAQLISQALPGADIQLVEISTRGDRRLDLPIPEIGGQGVFVKEVQAAVIEGRADLAVHSAKDLPSVLTPGLVIGAFPERADPLDAIVGVPLAELGEGAVVASGSVRRRAQIAARYPEIEFVQVRGNIATRISQTNGGDSLVVAKAALDRLRLEHLCVEVLDPSWALPQVAQGAIAVECRSEDQDAVSLLGLIDLPKVRIPVEAERAFLSALGSGCDLPVAAHCQPAGLDGWTLRGMIAGISGTPLLNAEVSAPSAEIAGAAVVMAGDLLNSGGREILDRLG